MRVAHVTATFPPYLGGAGTTAFEMADRLARRGHDVEVVTARAPGQPPPTAARVRRLAPLAAIGNAPLLPPLARLRGADVIHLHHPFIFGGELLSLARLRHRARLVVSYHNRLVGDGLRRPLFAAYEETWGRALMRTADAICILSRQHAETVDYLRAIRRRRPGVLAELPNGVDLESFRPGEDDAGVRAANGIPADAIVVAYVATLDRAHWLKRPDLAVQAVARAGDPRLHLLVAGGGEWLAEVRGRAAAAGLAQRTTFLGPVGHGRLPSVLRAADLLLCPSDRESFGIVLIEAMACGLPTVSTDPPGVRAVVDAPRTGLLAPVGDADALAGALRRLADAPEERRAIGAAGRARCEERYGWEAVVDRLEAIYDRVTG